MGSSGERRDPLVRGWRRGGVPYRVSSTGSEGCGLEWMVFVVGTLGGLLGTYDVTPGGRFSHVGTEITFDREVIQ